MAARQWHAGLACALVSICLSSAQAQEQGQDGSPTQEPSEHLSRQSKQTVHYLWETFGPPGLIGAGLSSGFQQWRDAPHEWEQTRSGYWQRFASEFAESSISDTTR